MKEKTLIELKNKVELLGGIISNHEKQLEYVKTMVVGLTTVIKNMPDYNEALEKTIEDNNKKKDELEQ